MKDITSRDAVLKNSNIALDHWGELWKKNCELNKDKIKTTLKDFTGLYRNKIVVLFAFGPSIKENIKEFKKEFSDRSKVVVGCVDKAFKTLVENGIQPDFCLLADGSVSIDWIKGVDGEAIKKSYLISNVYGSPDWCKLWSEAAGNNKILWFLNKDNINSHNIYGDLVGYYDVIEAASNVGNSLVVFSVKIFGAKNVMLYGYDYSWDVGTYYGNGNHKKSKLLGTYRELDINGNLVFTSDNMRFSCDWLWKYCMLAKQQWNVDIFNRTGRGILNIRRY